MDTRSAKQSGLQINPVGDLLRGWRNRRAMSQADLAFEAGISIKHLSYVETGKAVGSRDILLQLAAALGLSLRDRNALLEAGGFARQYGERDLSAPEVADAKRAIDLLLSRHEPFPAIVTDRPWNVRHGQATRASASVDVNQGKASRKGPASPLIRNDADRPMGIGKWRGRRLLSDRRARSARLAKKS